DEVGAAVVLATERVEKRLPWPGISHVRGKEGQDDAAFGEVAFQQNLVAAQPNCDRQVVAFRLSGQRMKEQTVDRLERALLDVFMGAVNRVAGLKGDDALPAQ